MAMMVDRNAPYSGLSSLMALKGRMGDTELVHMSKPEIKSLESMGQMTRNPSTGLPEAFKLRDAIPAAAGIGASLLAPGVGTALFGMSPIWSTALAAGAGTGLGSLAVGKRADESLFNAALAFGIGGVVGNLTAGADPTQGGKLLKEVTPEMALESQAAGASSGITPRTAGDYIAQADMTRPAASQFGQMFGGSPTALEFKAGDVITPEKLAQLTGGRMGAVPQFGTMESIGSALSRPMTYAPLAGAALTYAGKEEMPPMEDMGPIQQKRFTISGGEPLNPPATGASALDIALGRAPSRRYVSPYTTVQTLQEGGQPSASGKFSGYTDDEDTSITEDQRERLINLEEALYRSLRNYGLEDQESREEARKRIFRKMTPTYLPNEPRPSEEEMDAQIKRLEEALGRVPAAAKGGHMKDVTEDKKYFEGRVTGNGDGMSDEVQFDVEGGNPDIAMLSRDEYVLPADVVAMIGNGSSNAGADKLDAFVKGLRKKSFGTPKQQRELKDGGLSGLKIKKLEDGGEVGNDVGYSSPSENDAPSDYSGSNYSSGFSLGDPVGPQVEAISQGMGLDAAQQSAYSVENAPQSFGSMISKEMDPARSGPALVGMVGGAPLGGIARAMEAINNTYYGGQARAFSAQDEANMASRSDAGLQFINQR
jgi:hypothetical protein